MFLSRKKKLFIIYMDVQSVRVSKEVSKKEADEIVKRLGFKINVKPNPQYKNFHSYRQVQPEKFKKESFRIKTIKKKPKVFLVMGLRRKNATI